jgi:hypothetical protein
VKKEYCHGSAPFFVQRLERDRAFAEKSKDSPVPPENKAMSVKFRK